MHLSSAFIIQVLSKANKNPGIHVNSVLNLMIIHLTHILDNPVTCSQRNPAPISYNELNVNI